MRDHHRRHRYHHYHHFFGRPLLVDFYTHELVLPPCRARIEGGCGQILVTAVTAVTEDEYGLEDPCLGSETFLQEVSVVRDARERRMFV